MGWSYLLVFFGYSFGGYNRVMGIKNFKLGDVIEKALATVGVTEERVAKALGRPCGCKARKEKLNRLSLWAARVVTGKTEDAEKYLEEIIGETPRLTPEQNAEIDDLNDRTDR